MARPRAVGPARGLRVLVVDDSPIGLQLTRVLLERDGHRVVAAATSEAALRAFLQQRPDVVLTDIQLPGADGVELMRRLRAACARAGRPAPPVVAMTGSVEPLRERFLQLGFDDFLAKPVGVERLREVLRHAAGDRAAPTAPEQAPV